MLTIRSGGTHTAMRGRFTSQEGKRRRDGSEVTEKVPRRLTEQGKQNSLKARPKERKEKLPKMILLGGSTNRNKGRGQRERGREEK